MKNLGTSQSRNNFPKKTKTFKIKNLATSSCVRTGVRWPPGSSGLGMPPGKVRVGGC